MEDGTLAADKPLAEVLRERKEAKEAAFQDKWRLMKQGGWRQGAGAGAAGAGGVPRQRNLLQPTDVGAVAAATHQ